MKNLDLNSFGVQEMNADEIKKTDGGLIPLLIQLAALIIIGILAESAAKDGNPDTETYIDGVRVGN